MWCHIRLAYPTVCQDNMSRKSAAYKINFLIHAADLAVLQPIIWACYRGDGTFYEICGIPRMGTAAVGS